MDVGEDFLDLATIAADSRMLGLARVGLSGLDAGEPISDLARRIAAAVPRMEPGAIAMVDSPRWPVDLDNSSQIPKRRADGARVRGVDAILRTLVAELGTHRQFRGMGRLAMFPTPPLHYFLRCVGSPACKPHLRAIGCELLAAAPDAHARLIIERNDLTPPIGGAIFTRFMLAGFAAYRALDAMGVRTFESYPDLQFRLWSHGAPLPPKKRGRDAFAARQRIDLRLARTLGLSDAKRMTTLDEADAAILALGAAAARAAGVLAVVENRCEGRFALALDRAAAHALGLSAPIRM
ncbi:MAG: hypothetical protein ACREQN_09435 [Candidatus Binataceae bacterium]